MMLRVILLFVFIAGAGLGMTIVMDIVMGVGLLYFAERFREILETAVAEDYVSLFILFVPFLLHITFGKKQPN
ncbi:hypothetical protein [Fictibacillus iocasae]